MAMAWLTEHRAVRAFEAKRRKNPVLNRQSNYFFNAGRTPEALPFADPSRWIGAA